MSSEPIERGRTLRPAHRRALLPALAAVGALVLTGCSGPAPVDDAALERWSAARTAAVDGDDDAMGELFARADAGQAEEDPGTQVSTTFPGPVRVDALEFSCFGDGTVVGTVEIESGGVTETSTADPMQCGEPPVRIRVSERTLRKVDRVGFGATDASRDTAWFLTVRGSDGGSRVAATGRASRPSS
jgi:hypothetical protein